ncbi:PREDICTED: hemicentin-2-like isoform X2 [Scomber scombrus]|uniref:PREDICTED: hemicentin-2-like isoform X2 n=1 Tax=Scomber scombrus TaxID=13677 RepID=A0AAV1N441_SCOSC
MFEQEVIMFRPEQAALLSFQLLIMGHVFAVLGSHTDEYRNILVSRGNDTVLTFNLTMKNTTQIFWKKSKTLFSFKDNMTLSHFTSHRLSIDLNFPAKLNMFNAQQEDAGLYTCEVIDKDGVRTIQWNLTVLENLESKGYHVQARTSSSALLPAINNGPRLCRLSIDLNFPAKLNMFNAQQEDAGLYTCEVIDKDGVRTIQWNLTVLENLESKEIGSSIHYLYILTPAIGLLLCGLSSALCLCSRNLRTTTPNQSPILDQFPPQSEGEVSTVCVYKLAVGDVCINPDQQSHREKLKTTTPNQGPVPDQFPPQSGGEQQVSTVCVYKLAV